MDVIASRMQSSFSNYHMQHLGGSQAEISLHIMDTMKLSYSESEATRDSIFKLLSRECNHLRPEVLTGHSIMICIRIIVIPKWAKYLPVSCYTLCPSATWSPLIKNPFTHAGFWNHLEVQLEPKQHVLIIRANSDTTPAMLDIPVISLRQLVHKFGCVSLRGFKQDECMVRIAEHMGSILEWQNSFGKVLDILYQGPSKLNAKTLERLPMHFDGLFKKKSSEARELGDVPLFQFFHCVQAYPGNCNDGKTLFTDTRTIWNAWDDQLRACAASTSVVCRSPMFGEPDLVHHSPIIKRHPITKEHIIRFHEPIFQKDTQAHPVYISTMTSLNSVVCIEDIIIKALYSKEYCYEHVWVRGEFLISDNLATLHARQVMKQGGRHIRRIHIN